MNWCIAVYRFYDPQQYSLLKCHVFPPVLNILYVGKKYVKIFPILRIWGLNVYIYMNVFFTSFSHTRAPEFVQYNIGKLKNVEKSTELNSATCKNKNKIPWHFYFIFLYIYTYVIFRRYVYEFHFILLFATKEIKKNNNIFSTFHNTLNRMHVELIFSIFPNFSYLNSVFHMVVLLYRLEPREMCYHVTEMLAECCQYCCQIELNLKCKWKSKFQLFQQLGFI